MWPDGKGADGGHDMNEAAGRRAAKDPDFSLHVEFSCMKVSKGYKLIQFLASVFPI